MRIVMTRDFAYRISADAANRAMRTGNRRAWNEDDADVYLAEYNRIWPLCPHKVEPDGWCPHCDGFNESDQARSAPVAV